MTDLLTRLEQATEGSRELDAEIAQAAVVPETVSDGVQEFPVDPLPYTTSLDAALMLVPGGWHPSALNWSLSTNHCLAALYKEPLLPGVTGQAPTPALALCIAALKAKDNG